MNQTLETIYSRRSTRNYTDKPIDEQELDAILKAGVYAPSGGNMQYNHFIVIQNKQTLDNLNRLVQDAFASMEVTEDMYKSLKSNILQAKSGKLRFTYNANTLVIVANKKNHGNAMADSVCAIENMLVAAHSLDLGACYINQLNWLNTHQPIIDFLEPLGLEKDEIIKASLILGHSNNIPNTKLKRHGNKITHIK